MQRYFRYDAWSSSLIDHAVIRRSKENESDSRIRSRIKFNLHVMLIMVSTLCFGLLSIDSRSAQAADNCAETLALGSDGMTLGTGDNLALHSSQAINHLRMVLGLVMKRVGDPGIKRQVNRSLSQLQDLQYAFIEIQFGLDHLRLWQRHRSQWRKNKDRLPSDVKKKMDVMGAWLVNYLR